MARRDAAWAVQQYEAVRALLPQADMPGKAVSAPDLGAIADAFDVFLLDAFGVLNVGNSAIEGALARVQALQRQGKRVLVLTNGATFPAEGALKKFTDFGFEFALEDIVSSRDALGLALGARRETGYWGVMAGSGARVETLGPPCKRLEACADVYDAACGFLLLSASYWDDEKQGLLHESLAKAPRPVLVGNPDIVAPREDHLSLEPGYFGYALAQSLGTELALYGKPFGNIFDLAFSRLPDVDPARVAMVGDTLHTDVLGGAAYGVKTVLVSDHGLFAGRDPVPFISQTGITPDYIIPSI